MDRTTFWSLWIGGAAVAFGMGRLLGAASAPPAAPAGISASGGIAVPSEGSNVAPATSEAAAAAPAAAETAEPRVATAESPTPERATPPSPPPIAEEKAEAPAESTGVDRSAFGLPTETGVEEGAPPPNAKPLPLAKAPPGWVPSPARGSDDPLVVVIVSSDFQCPVCRRVVLPTEQLVRDVPQDVRVEFKQHPLSSHARAEAAAVASLAAHKQGRFWDYHDLLFGNFGRLSDADFEDFAKQLNLDLEQFRKDLVDPALLAQAKSEGLAADNQEARGTPGFFINGRKQVGWGSYFGFKGMVTRELEAAKALEAQGLSRDEIRRRRAKENADKGQDFVDHFIDGVPAS